MCIFARRYTCVIRELFSTTIFAIPSEGFVKYQRILGRTYAEKGANPICTRFFSQFLHLHSHKFWSGQKFNDTASAYMQHREDKNGRLNEKLPSEEMTPPPPPHQRRTAIIAKPKAG